MNKYEKPDYYSKLAFKEGYFARSVYKLKEIDEKFNLFKEGMSVLDLGCAPGSWSQYVSRVVGNKGKLVGIDYKKILMSAPNAFFVHGNFHKEENKEAIREHSPFDAIISDMAPDTTGDRLADCFQSSELVRTAIDFSYEYLNTGGFFIAKIFQGGEEREIVKTLKESFRSVNFFKPKTCRKKSFETFIVAVDYHTKPKTSDDSKNEYEKFLDENQSGVMPW